MDQNIYFGVYARREKKGKAKCCSTVKVLWADYDHMTLDQVKNRITNVGLPEPSIFVSSGHGVHTYWILTKRTSKGVTELLRAIAIKTGGDIKTTDRARIMRLPGSMNVKGAPLKCEVVEASLVKYDLETIANTMSIKLQEKVQITEKQAIDIGPGDRHCIREIAKGVGEGFRNFALGRLTKYLQMKGFSKVKSQEIILKWNRFNDPPEKERKLLKDFNSYWQGDYKLLGCSIKNPDMQKLLGKICNRPECKLTTSIGHLKIDNTIGLNNRIFNYYTKVTGNDLIVYGLLLRHKEGLATEQLISKLTPRKSKKPCISKMTLFNKKATVKLICTL